MLLFENLKYKIFCDMDGVIVNFDEGYKQLPGALELDGTYQSSEEFWAPINSAGKEFWENLNWMPDGKKLWEYIDEYYPIILSSPSRKGYGSREGKKNWVDRELPGVPLILEYSFNKQKYSGPHNILIDDRPSNIDQWISKGGIGILHKSTEETIKILSQEYGL
jgi:hypothetical protein